jgi:hypothetical protein
VCLYQLQSGTGAVEGVSFFGEGAMSEHQMAFVQFLAKYGKSYSTKSDLNARFSAFIANFEKVKAHNVKTVDGFKQGLNHFSDLSLEEFTERYGLNALKRSGAK